MPDREGLMGWNGTNARYDDRQPGYLQVTRSGGLPDRIRGDPASLAFPMPGQEVSMGWDGRSEYRPATGFPPPPVYPYPTVPSRSDPWWR